MLSPSLMLDFTTEAGRRAARRHLSCTRAGTGSEWTPQGVLRPDVPANWCRWGESGLLVEQGASNVARAPKDLTDAVWVNHGGAITSAAYSDPVMPHAFELSVPDDGLAEPRVLVDSVSTTAKNLVTAYFKKNNWRYVRLGSSRYVYITAIFDLDTATLASVNSPDPGFSPSITYIREGWYRAAYKSKSVHGYYDDLAVGLAQGPGDVNVVGSGGKSVYVAYPTCEPGGTKVSSFCDGTRPQDDVFLALGDWLNRTEGTWLAEWVTPSDSSGVVLDVQGAIELSAHGVATFISSPTATLSAQKYASPATGSIQKAVLGARWDSDPIASSVPGDTPIRIGSRFGSYGRNFLDSHIRRLVYFPGLLAQAQAEALVA